MIYFAFSGSDGDLRSLGIGEAGEAEWVQFGPIIIGIVHSTHYRSRAFLEKVDARLVTMPGPAIGKLGKQDVAALSAAAPTAKEGDAFSSVLSLVYAATSHEGFNPNHF